MRQTIEGGRREVRGAQGPQRASIPPYILCILCISAMVAHLRHEVKAGCTLAWLNAGRPVAGSHGNQSSTVTSMGRPSWNQRTVYLPWDAPASGSSPKMAYRTGRGVLREGGE